MGRHVERLRILLLSEEVVAREEVTVACSGRPNVAGRRACRENRPVPPEPPRVRCIPRGDVLRPAADETLLDAALRQGVPLASSCGGKAVCGDCLVRVVEGAEHLSAPSADEIAWRRRRAYAGAGRLGCCVRATGDAAVATTYW